MPTVAPPRIERLILHYLNHFTDPDEFSERVKDDPESGSARGIGLPVAIARGIYRRRQEMPGGKFETVEQFKEITGLDDDTYHNIFRGFAALTPEARALVYLNTANDPLDLVALVRDDPDYGSKKGYGLRIDAAEALIEFRQNRHGKKIRSLEELIRVKHIGEDTLHDIALSFGLPTESAAQRIYSRTEELRTLRILGPMLSANYGATTLAASLATKGLHLEPRQVEILAEQAPAIISHHPRDVAKALVIPATLAGTLIEALGNEEIDLSTEDEEGPAEELNQGRLEWLEEMERREEAGEPLEEDLDEGEETPREFSGSMYDFSLDFLEIFPPPEPEEEIPTDDGEVAATPEPPVDINRCFELTQKANALAAVLTGIKGQALEIISEVGRLDGVIREYFQGAIDKLKLWCKWYAEECEKLDKDKEYQKLIERYQELTEKIEKLESAIQEDTASDGNAPEGDTPEDNDSEKNQKELDQANQELEELGQQIEAREEAKRKALKDLKRAQDERTINRRTGEIIPSPNEQRANFCREDHCLEYNHRYRVLKHRYDALKRAWESNLEAWKAAVAACQKNHCPYRDADTAFPEFPPNLCSLICETIDESRRDGWEENGVYKHPLCRLFPPPDEDGAEVPVAPGDENGEPIGLQPPDDETGDCADCHSWYRSFVVHAAQVRQEAMDSLAKQWTDDIIERYGDFYGEHGPQIEQLLEILRLADAQLRAASCEIVSEPNGRSHVQSRSGADPATRDRARAARRAIRQATRRLDRLSKKLEKINQRLARYQRRLKERYDDAVETVKHRYELYLAKCNQCDPGLPVVVERFIFMEPESIEIPPTFNGDCNDISALDKKPAPNDTDDDPVRRPDNDAPGEGEEEKPADGDPPPPDPVPEEEIPEAIDELLALPLPCEVEKAAIAQLRVRVAALVGERLALRTVLDREQRRLLAVLQVAEAGLRVSEAEIKRLEAELQKIRGDYIKQVQRKYPSLSEDNIFGTATFPPTFDPTLTVDMSNAHRAFQSAFDRALNSYRQAFDRYQQDYRVYKDAYDAYDSFLKGPFEQGRTSFNQKGEELRKLLDRIAELLRKCGADADPGAVEKWEPGEEPPDEMEEETRDTVEKLERERGEADEAIGRLEQELEDLEKRGPYGRRIKRLLELDKTIEEIRRRAQERMDEIRRERGEGRAEVEDIAEINRQLERELDRLRKRRQEIMEGLRRMQGEVDRQYRELREQAVQCYRQRMAIIERLKLEETRLRGLQQNAEAEAIKTRYQDLEQRTQELWREDLRRIREHLGAEDFSEGDLFQQNLENYLQDILRKGVRLRELRRVNRARERAIERLRNGAPPTTAEMFEIFPDAAGPRGPLEHLLAAVARPGAFIAQRKDAPRRVLGPEMDAKRAKLDLKAIAAAATEAGVNGNLLADLLLRGPLDLQEMWRTLRQVLADGLQNQDGAGDELIRAAAATLADAYRRGELRPNFPLGPDQATLDDWRRWIESADPKTLLGLLIMRPPQTVAEKILARLEDLRNLGEVVEAGAAAALVRQILAGLARADELTRPIWTNAFEKALSLMDEAAREGLLNLLRMYQANLPDPDLDGLDTEALLRRMGQSGDWEEWRKLFARALAKAEPEHFKRLIDLIPLADFRRLTDFPNDELEAQQAALGGMIAEALAGLRGKGEDRQTWLDLYGELKQAAPALAGIRDIVGQRLRESLEQTDFNDLAIIDTLIELAMEEGPEGPLGIFELVLQAQSSGLVGTLIDKIQHGVEGENRQPEELLLQYLALHPDLSSFADQLSEGLRQEKSRREIVDILELLGGNLGENLGVDTGDAERSSQYFELLARMFGAAQDEQSLGRLVGLIRRIDPKVQRRELDEKVAEGGEESLRQAFELSWAIGTEGLSFLTARLDDESLDSNTRETLKALLFNAGHIVYRPAGLSWEKVAERLYGDTRFGPFLAAHRIGGSEQQAKEAWLPAPDRIELDSEIHKTALDLSVSAIDLASGINQRGLAETERNALREMLQRLNRLRGGWDMDGIARFNEAKSLHLAVQRIVNATRLRQELAALFERPGIAEPDRALFERFAAKMRALYSTRGSESLFEEIQRYHGLLEQMLPMAAQRAQLEQLSRQIGIDYGGGRQDYGTGEEAKRLAIHTIRQFTRERAGLKGRLDSLEIQLSMELEKFSSDSREITDLDDALARLRAELGRAIHSGRGDSIGDDRKDVARQAAKDLVSAWGKAVGFVPERMWLTGNLLDADRDGEQLFQDLVALFNADRRIREEAPLRRREMDELIDAIKVFDLEAYTEHVQKKENRQAADDPDAQARIAKRRETQEFIRPLENLERESRVTPEMHTNLGKAIDNIGDELSDLDSLINEHMGKIRRNDPKYQAQWNGVLRALRLSQEALNRASDAWYRGENLRALRELKDAMTEMGVTSVGFSNEVELFTYHQQIKLINDYYDSHFETPFESRQRDRYIRIAEALIAGRKKVRAALDTFGASQQRQQAILEANNGVGALIQDQHYATIDHIQFFYKVESTGKALLAVAAAALTAGLLTPIAEAALANVALMGLRVLQVGRAISLLPRAVTLGSLLFETAVFTSVHHVALNLLQNKVPVNEGIFKEYLKNLALFGLLKAVGLPFADKVGENIAVQLAKSFGRFGAEAGIFFGISAIESMWHNISKGNSPTEGIVWDELLLQTVLSLAVMKQAAVLGRNLVPQRVMDRLLSSPDIPAARLREINERLTELNNDIAGNNAEFNRLLEGERTTEQDSLNELFQQQQRLLERKAKIALELELIGVVEPGAAAALYEFQRSSLSEVRSAVRTGHELLEEVGMRRLTDDTYTFRKGKEADLKRILLEQGFTVHEGLSNIVAHIGEQVVFFRARTATESEVGSRPELAETLNRLRLEGHVVRMMLERPNTFRAIARNGEIHLIRVRPGESARAGLDLPVEPPTTARSPGEFRIAKLSPRLTADEVKFRFDGRNLEASGRSLSELFNEILVAQGLGRGVDLIVTPEKMIGVEMADGLGLRPEALLENPVVKQLQRFANEHGLNLAVGMRFYNGTADANGAVIFRAGKRPRLIRDRERLDGQNRPLDEVLRLTMVEINGMRVSFSVGSDPVHLRGDAGDAHVILTRVGEAVVDRFRNLVPDAVIANWAGGPMGGSPGISFHNHTHPARVVENLSRRTPETARPALARLLEDLKQLGNTRLPWQVARELLADADTHDWARLEAAQNQGAGAVRQLYELLGETAGLGQLLQFMKAANHLPETQRSQALRLIEQTWAGRIGEIARELPYHPRLAETLRGEAWGRLADRIKLETGVDLTTLPSPFAASSAWRTLIAELGFGRAPHGAWRELGRSFDINTLRELTPRTRTPERLKDRVVEDEIPNLKQHLESLGIKVDFVSEPFGNDARAEIEGVKGNWTIRLNERSTWLDLLNEIYKVKLLQELGVDGETAFTSEMRAAIELASFRFLERQILRGSSLTGRLGESVRMGLFWSTRLGAIRDGRIPNLAENLPGEPILIQAAANARIPVSLRVRVARMVRLLEVANPGSGTFSGRYSEETIQTMERLTELAARQLELNQQAMNDLYRAVRLISEAQTSAQRETAEQMRRVALERMDISQREAVSKLNLVMDIIHVETANVIARWGVTHRHEHAAGRFDELVTEYNQLTSLIKFAWRRAMEAREQGRILDHIVSLTEAYRLQARRNRISERLGSEGAAEAFESRHPDAVLLWPRSTLAGQPGAGRLDRVYRLGDEIIVIEEKGGSSTPGTAEYLGRRAMQTTLAHTLGTAARMQIAGEELLRNPDATATERAYAEELIATARGVIEGWQNGKLRIFLAGTRWIKVDGRATGWEATTLTGVELRWGPRYALPTQYADYLGRIVFIEGGIESAVNRILELREGFGGND